MTADEIRATCADDDEWTSELLLREIALQLALGNERLERIATALEVQNLPRLAYRQPITCPTCGGTSQGTNTTSGVCRTCWGRKTL